MVARAPCAHERAAGRRSWDRRRSAAARLGPLPARLGTAAAVPPPASAAARLGPLPARPPGATVAQQGRLPHACSGPPPAGADSLAAHRAYATWQGGPHLDPADERLLPTSSAAVRAVFPVNGTFRPERRPVAHDPSDWTAQRQARTDGLRGRTRSAAVRRSAAARPGRRTLVPTALPFTGPIRPGRAGRASILPTNGCCQAAVLDCRRPPGAVSPGGSLPTWGRQPCRSAGQLSLVQSALPRNCRWMGVSDSLCRWPGDNPVARERAVRGERS